MITLTTDFGSTDFYVAAMKAVLLRHCTDAVLVDITHEIFRHDLRSASFTLERAVHSFDSGTVHLAVVDPGVGSDRNLLIVEINGAMVVCPDNGLITWAWRRHPHAKATELTWRPARSSTTFHGRDIMAPVAGMLAAGSAIAQLGGDVIEPILLNMAPAATCRGEVIHIDHFGNATTNIPAEFAFASFSKAVVTGMTVPLKRTYSEVEIGQPLALVGSSALIEIAVRNGSAAAFLDLKLSDRVELIA